jgi:Mg2+-importing ATPase
MTFTTLLVMAVGLWLPFSPLAPFLGLVRLPPVFFLWMGGFLLAYSVLTHNVKTWFYRRFGTD